MGKPTNERDTAPSEGRSTPELHSVRYPIDLEPTMILLLASFAFADPGGAACVMPRSLSAEVFDAVRDLHLDPTTHRQVLVLAGSACEDLREDAASSSAAWDVVDFQLSEATPVMSNVLHATEIAGRFDSERQAREMTFLVQVATVIGPDSWAKVQEALAAP